MSEVLDPEECAECNSDEYCCYQIYTYVKHLNPRVHLPSPKKLEQAVDKDIIPMLKFFRDWIYCFFGIPLFKSKCMVSYDNVSLPC